MSTLLGTEKDKNGNDINIHFCKYEQMTSKLTAFFIRQWAELMEAGHCTENYVPKIDNCRIIYATSGDEIVGLRMWVWEYSTARIILSAVDKRFRKLGVFKMIVDYYDERMINGSCDKAVTTIHVGNARMLELAKNSGFKALMVKMVKIYTPPTKKLDMQSGVSGFSGFNDLSEPIGLSGYSGSDTGEYSGNYDINGNYE